MAESPWLTVREAAHRAKVGAKAIYAAISRRQLRAVHVGTGLRLHTEWVDAWLDEGGTEVNPDAPGRPIPWKRRG